MFETESKRPTHETKEYIVKVDNLKSDMQFLMIIQKR